MSSPVVIQLAEKVKRLLAGKSKTAALRRLLSRHNFADVADMMEYQLSEEEAVACFQLLNVGHAANVLSGLSDERQLACLSSLPVLMSSKILRFMPGDDAVDILQEMDTDQSRKILDQMPFDSDTRMIQHLLLEEPDTAAGLMSPDYIQVPVDGTVGDAMTLIRRAEEKDFIYYCYLVDENRHLRGVVSLKSLILHDDSVPLSRIAIEDVKSILESYDQELVAVVFRKYYNLLAMPVVDSEDVLRGIITLDDVIDVIEEEVSEDIYRASGINVEEIDEKNLLTGPVVNAVKARIPWLSITVVGHMFAAVIIASYQKTVAAAVIAVSFIPLLTGLTGNIGTQSDTIAVRGLSQKLITSENIREKLWRELRVALIMGTIFATTVGGFSFMVYRHVELTLMLTVWIVVALCISASLGILIPYTYSRIFKQDPAGVGGPFLTTMSDILTFTLYLYILTMFLDRMI